MYFQSIKTKIVVIDARLSFVWEMPSFSHINMIQSFIHIPTGNSPYQGKDLAVLTKYSHKSKETCTVWRYRTGLMYKLHTHKTEVCTLCAYIFISFYSEVCFFFRKSNLQRRLGLCVAQNKLCLTCSAQYFQACLGSMLANLATMFERKIFRGFLVAMANY